MAITSVKLLGAGRERTIDALDGFKRTYRRAWLVESDTAGENEVSVSIANASPSGAVARIGDAHPNDSRAFCVRKQTRLKEDTESGRKLWRVVAEYQTLKREESKKFTHPLSRPYEIEYRGDTFQTIAEKDIFNRGIVNSAGQYFDPPIPVDNVRPVITIQRNEATFSGMLASQYQEAINNDTFLFANPYTVKCKQISAKRVIEEFTLTEGSEAQVIFFNVQYEFHFWWQTWWLFPLDQGRYELGSSATSEDKLVPIQDSLGQNVTDPVPLNGNGQALPPSTLPDSAVYMTYRYYRELPFAAFGF